LKSALGSGGFSVKSIVAKATWTVAAALALLGAALFIRGSDLPLYRDEAEFQRRYMEIDPYQADASRIYRGLREEFMTARISWQNYGNTLMMVGCLLPAAASGFSLMQRMARKRFMALLLGIAAAVATTGTELVSLFLDLQRGEFPWFADSIIIPMIGLPFILLLLLGWVAVNLALRYEAQRSVKGNRRWFFRFWLRVMGVITCLLALRALGTGDFLFLAPSLLWLAFYFTLWRSLAISTVWSATDNRAAAAPR
jgi:hypothetical protein